MASVNSLSSSNSSSVYGNRTYNIISGLASGMDTEELISGVVQSYQQKIQSLQQEHTSLEWKQEAYQSISDKLVEFSRNYASYVYSSTNLLSSSFFNNAVITTTNGTNAGMVSASGKTSSNIIINSITRLATATRYVSSTAASLNRDAHTDPDSGAVTVTGGSLQDLDAPLSLNKLTGSLSLSYGSRTVSLEFGEREIFEKDGKFDADAFKSAVEDKLKEQQVTISSGSVVTADNLIGVNVSEDGTVSFYDKSSAGNKVSVSGASGDLKEMIPGLDSVVAGKGDTIQINVSEGVTKQVNTLDYLADKTISVTLDGKSKTIQLPSAADLKAADPDGTMSTAEQFQAALQTKLNNTFGANRIKVGLTDDQSAFTFQVEKGSTLAVSTSSDGAGYVLGIGSGLTSYLNTGKTLNDLNLGDWNWSDATTGQKVKGSGSTKSLEDGQGNVIGYVDSAGNPVDKDGYRLDENGQYLYGFDLIINDQKIGTYTKETELNTIINDINANTEAGVTVTYSQTSGQFVFTAKDTGSGGRVSIQAGGLADKLFGATMDASGNLLPSVGSDYSAGVDAQFNVSINGGEAMDVTRSSNTFDLDGMSITLNGTFTASKEEEKVTFTSKTDADTIVDAVKKMVEDLNEIIKEVKSAYSDMPLEKSDGSRYEPLTDSDMEDMSESAIEAYEEKAKTGILFMDRDLSSLYSGLRNAISASGSDGSILRSIGIETSYSDGLTTLTLDENKFREALESDPNKVQQAFTKSKENGAATDGLMTSIQNIVDRYASTTGEPKGILIEKAGSKYSPSAALDNTLLNQMKDVEEEISTWQDKMSNKVDYYTNKFTQLELLINQMNSQSSALSGLLGG